MNHSIHRRDIDIMIHAGKLSEKSNMQSCHACIIIDKKGKMISEAHNQSLPISKKKAYTSSTKLSYHAEENALKNVDHKKLNGAKLYVVRCKSENNIQTFMNSKPCDRCTIIIKKYMKKSGLKVVYYSTDDTNQSICALDNM